MVLSQIDRRSLLTTFAALITVFSSFARAASGTAGERKVSISFFVAGVRFQPAVVRGLHIGSFVQVVASDDGKSLTVRAMTGELIGYVPEGLISAVHDLKDQRAVLRMADYDAVPWKRFQVEIKPC